MSKQAWICEGCLTPYLTEEAAQGCEERHPKIETMKIVGMVFARNDAAGQAPSGLVVEQTHTESWMRGAKSIVRYHRREKDER